MRELTTIPERLALLRQLAGASQREASEISGLTPAHYRLLECGERDDPTSDTMRRIAAAFGVSLDYLINGEGDAPTAEQVLAVAGPLLDKLRADRAAAAAERAAAKGAA